MTEVMAVLSEYRMNQWAGIIEKRWKNGLIVKEFCRRNELSKGTYHYWLKMIRVTIAENAQPKFVEPNENGCGWTEQLFQEMYLHIEYHGITVEIQDGADMNGVPELLAAMKRL